MPAQGRRQVTRAKAVLLAILLTGKNNPARTCPKNSSRAVVPCSALSTVTRTRSLGSATAAAISLWATFSTTYGAAVRRAAHTWQSERLTLTYMHAHAHLLYLCDTPTHACAPISGVDTCAPISGTSTQTYNTDQRHQHIQTHKHTRTMHGHGGVCLHVSACRLLGTQPAHTCGHPSNKPLNRHAAAHGKLWLLHTQLYQNTHTRSCT